MLVVKTVVKESPLEGRGLFADERIPVGATIWKYDPTIDLMYDPAEVEEMPKERKEDILRYAYLSMSTGKYVYPTDGARFVNHSASHPNMKDVPFPGEVETRGIAMRDIEPGDEILIDYRTIDADDAKSNEAYLDK